MKVAGVQMDVAFADVSANLARIEKFIQEASGQGAELIVFPECALTGYCYTSLEEALPQAEPIPGPSVRRLVDVCRQTNSHAVVGMLERVGSQLFNACVLVGPAGVVGGYRKVHLPGLGVDHFATPGDRPFQVWEANGVRLGMNICYDGAFPEGSRVMTLAGADLIVLPTNWPTAAESFARHAINTRAMENHVYYMSVDRVGEERGYRFIGMSKICDPTGETIVLAGSDEETILYAEIDPAWARRKRQVRIPGLHEIDRIADRRPEMYGPISQPSAFPAKAPADTPAD